MNDNNVINISSLNKISIKKANPKKECMHRNIEVDKTLNLIICDDCKKEINPIHWLGQVADEEKFYQWAVDEYEKKYKAIGQNHYSKDTQLKECNETISAMHNQIVDMGEAINHAIIELESLYKRFGYANSNVLRELKDAANIK